MPMREVEGILLNGARIQTHDKGSIYPFDFFFKEFEGKYVQIRVQEVGK